MFWWSFKLIWLIAKFRLDTAGTAFFFFPMLHSFVKPASVHHKLNFWLQTRRQPLFPHRRKSWFCVILYEDKLILHSLDLICCVSNNFLALFGNNLLPHRPPLFSVQFPDNIHTVGDQNNTDKTWFQSTLTGCFIGGEKYRYFGIYRYFSVGIPVFGKVQYRFCLEFI